MLDKNYITDIRNTQVTLPDGSVTEARWMQFKIPVSQPENTMGNISDFRSIRFMRMFMTDFNDQVYRSFWCIRFSERRMATYTNTLDFNDTILLMTTNLDVLAVNVQEITKDVL
jgi:cell surface protein SprA